MNKEIFEIVSKLSKVKERKIFGKKFDDILEGKITMLDLINDKTVEKEIEKIKRQSEENNNLLTRVDIWTKPKVSDKIPAGF